MSYVISKKDWNTIQNYSKYAWDEHQSEIGGYMVVVKEDDGTFRMLDPVILKQEITAGNTVIDRDDLAKYLMKTGMQYHPKDIYYCWWHSHHTMAAFWSGTDLTAIQQSSNSKVSFSLVVNLKEEYKFRISIWEPLEVHVDVDIEIEGMSEIPKGIVNKVDKLCTKPTSVITTMPKVAGSYKSGWTYNNKNQVSIFTDDEETGSDAERVNLECKVDDVLLNYLTNNNYNKYSADIGKINQKLRKDKSELRVGKISKDYLDLVINFVDADCYIHAKGTKFDPDVAINQANALSYGGWR
tara:strand:- start:4963 stop:5853 length:891 start_codon:yes stop_codon:yes gene_type:complete